MGDRTTYKIRTPIGTVNVKLPSFLKPGKISGTTSRGDFDVSKSTAPDKIEKAEPKSKKFGATGIINTSERSQLDILEAEMAQAGQSKMEQEIFED